MYEKRPVYIEIEADSYERERVEMRRMCVGERPTY